MKAAISWLVLWAFVALIAVLIIGRAFDNVHEQVCAPNPSLCSQP